MSQVKKPPLSPLGKSSGKQKPQKPRSSTMIETKISMPKPPPRSRGAGKTGRATKKLPPGARKGSMDRGRLLKAVKQDWMALREAPDAMKDDREIVLAAVAQRGSALEYASSALKGDREIVLAAVAQNGIALMHAAAALRANREFMLAAVKLDHRALQFASAEVRDDAELVAAAAATATE
jgi:hypothetical protein